MRRGLVGAIEDISMTERNLDPIEYVRLVVDTIQQDIGRTHVRVVASLAIIGVFLTKLKDVRTLDGLWQWPKFGGIGLLVLAALSYFQKSSSRSRWASGSASTLWVGTGSRSSASCPGARRSPSSY